MSPALVHVPTASAIDKRFVRKKERKIALYALFVPLYFASFYIYIYIYRVSLTSNLINSW